MDEHKGISAAKAFDDACKAGRPTHALTALHEMERSGANLMKVQSTVQDQLVDLVVNSFKTEIGLSELKGSSKALCLTISQYEIPPEKLQKIQSQLKSNEHFLIYNTLAASGSPDLP